MKQKHKRFLTRALALGMTLCMSVQMLPVQALAVESQATQTDSEIEDLQNEIADLEQQVEDLLGRSLEEVYETSPDSDVDSWDAYETDEVSSAPVMLTSTGDVTEITDESAFEFDAETGTITGFTAPSSGYYTVVVPDTIGGVAVTAIGANVFQDCLALLSVELPASVQAIGNYAFDGCWDLVDVTLPERLETIGQYAFQDTLALTGITELPESVTSVRYCAFYRSAVQFTQLDLTNVLTVGGLAFYGIETLETVTLPADLSGYGTSIFSGCTGLTSVTFAEGATAIPESMFSGCTAIEEIDLPETVASIGNYAFNGCAALESIDISNVTTFGSSAFDGCSALTAVTLHEDVALANRLFAGTGLVEVTIPNSITELPDYIFKDCTALRSVTANYLETIGMYAFSGCASLTDFPDMTKVDDIGDSAFEGCLGLTRLDLYATDTTLTLEGSIVADCTNLEKIVLHGDHKAYTVEVGNSYYSPFMGAPEDVVFEFDGEPTVIGSGLFQYAPFVKDLDFIPESVVEYHEYAFAGTALTEIVIPEHVTNVKAACFAGCASLVKVEIRNPMSAYQTLGAYDDQTGWGNQSIDRKGFFSGTALADLGVADDKTDITFLHESWTEIPYGFFAGSSIRDTEFLAQMPNLEIINPYAFYYCTHLENLLIPEGVTTIEYRAFMESLSKVKVLTIPASVTSLSERWSTSLDAQYTQHFWSKYGNDALTDVYIYNPSLELYADEFVKDYRQIFGTYAWSTETPLKIHGVVDGDGNSTAEALCEASGGLYEFVPIGSVGKISLTVMAGDTDVTDLVGIEWKNSSGVVQSIKPTFQPHEAGLEYTYTVTLPEELLADYAIPAIGTVTSGQSQVMEVLNLTPVASASFTVEAPEGTYVEVHQTVNGIDSVYGDYVYEDGTVTINAKQGYTEVFAFRDGYYSRYAVISEPGAENTCDLSADWKLLPATAVIISAASLLDGVESPVADLSDFAFTVKNAAGEVIPATLQGNMLYLDETDKLPTAADRLTLTVEVDSTSDLIAPDPIGFTFADGEIHILFTSRGRISMKVSNWSVSDPEGFYLWIFDQDSGDLVDAYDMYYGFCQTDPLPQGTYTAVAIDMSVGIRSVPNISALRTFGLRETVHYALEPTAVSDGMVTDLGEVDVPDYATFGGALYVDMFEDASFDSSVTEPVVGQSFYLWFDYKFNETYASTNNKDILIQLPVGTYINKCYTPEGKGTYSYDEESGLLTVTTPVNEGQVYLSIKGQDADNCASVTAVAQVGAYTAKPVSCDLPIKDIFIEAFDVQNGRLKDRTIIVYGPPGAEVMLYVNGAPYQKAYDNGGYYDGDTVYTGKDGKATFTVDLPGPATASTRWELTATATMMTNVDGDYGATYETEGAKTIGYYVDPFNVQISTQSPWCMQGNYERGASINFNNVESRTKTYWMTYCEHYTWSATVAPGMGKYVKDGVIYLKLSRTKDGGAVYLPLSAIQEGGDTFAFMTDDILWHGYIDYYFDVTDEYYTEFLGQPVPVDEDYADAAAAKDQILQDLTGELEDVQDRYGEISYAALEAEAETDEEKAALLELKAIMRKAEIDVYDLLGLNVSGADEDEISKAMGITTRELERGELQTYENDSSFTKISEDGVVTQYVYADNEKSIVVDVNANTVTTRDYTALSSATPQTFRLKSTRSSSGSEEALEKKIDSAEEQIQEVADMVKKVQFAIGNIGDVADGLELAGIAGKIGGLAGAAASALDHVMKLYDFYSYATTIAEAYGCLDKIEAIRAEEDQVMANPDAYEDATACLSALRELRQAYYDLGSALGDKMLSMSSQLLVSLICIFTAIVSFGITFLLNIAAYYAGNAVDATLDENIERARGFIKMRQKEKSYACRPDKDESEDDPSCRPYMDPSGYVYEGVFSNRVEGLTVTTYTREDNGEPWDAAEFSQENPLFTDGIGFYRWDVPGGDWKVVVSENEDYYEADTTDIYSEEHMREGREDITADGWHTVLPIQTEVHIPVVSKHAPTVDEANTIPWSDGILVQFSQYMKEETVKDTVTVTMGGQTFSGEDLVITWPDQELSDHYYDRTFASQMLISRADGQTWTDEVTVSIAGGENYAGTALSPWTKTMDVVPVIAEIDAVEAVEVDAEESTVVTLTLRDASGNAIPGVPVTLSTGLYATLPDGGNNENRTLEAVSDANGQITVTVQGHYPGEDLLTITIPGRSGTWSIPIHVGDAAPLVAEPVVTINGRNYSGQGHVIQVEKGTVITVTGTYGDDLWYSIGESTCPCTESEQLSVKSGQLEITESGYYKFAAERDGVYSSRVHITIQVTVPTVRELEVSIPSLTPRINDAPYDLTVESINGGTDKLEKFTELYVEARTSANGGTYWTWYDWRRSDQQSASDLDRYYSMMMYKPVGDNVNSSYQFVSGAHYALIVQLPLGEEYADMPVAEDCVLVLTSPIGERRLTGEIVTEYSQDYLKFAVYYEKSTLLPEAKSYVNTLVENSDIGYISTEPGYWKEIKEGTVVTVTAWPYSEYWNTKAVSVTLADGTPVTVTRQDETTFTFIQPDGAVTISAEYGPISDETFSVTVIQPEEGATITVSPAEPQVAGTEITVTVAVQEGYKLNDWNPITVTDSTGETISNWGGSEENSYCFEMPLGGATVSAAVEPITYEIYPWVGDIDGNDCDYGAITVTPEEAVLGETVTVTVTADEGYLLGYLDIYYSYWDNDIGEWVSPRVDYTYTGEDGVYTFTQPDSPDGYINVDAYLIAESDRTLTVTQPANGSITVSPLQPYPEEEVKVKVDPDEGYEVKSLSATDSTGEPVEVTQQADGTYTYTQPEGMVSISAVIELQSGEHIHVFDKQKAEAQYLVSAADCENPAVYYLSCKCGEAGTDTFTSGTALGHDYSERIKDESHLRSDAATCQQFDTYWYDCSRCDANAKNDPNAADKFWNSTDAGEHDCSLEVPDAEFLNTAADCENAATYFKSCECGEKGADTFSYGTALGHTAGTAWEKDGTHHWHVCTVNGCGKVVEDTKATHTPDHEGGATEDYAILCTVCGYVMEQQLAHTHVFDKQKTEAQYLKSAADCENAAVYYMSCGCGEKGTETFTYGDALGHTSGTAWEKDATHHWHVCTVNGCGKVVEDTKATHTPDHEGGATEGYAILCTVCGYVMEQQLAHTHVFDKQKAETQYLKSAADCENAAVYYMSCGCGEKGTETFTYGDALGHSHSQDWKKDQNNHWHECSCGDKADVAGHEYGSDTTCDVCGYRKSSGGSGGGGGGSVSVTYTTAIKQAENGNISVFPEKAEAGDTVTITITPDKGYTLETLTVTDKNGKEIEVTKKDDNKYTFRMPSGKVTVEATFMEDNTMLNYFVDVFATDYYYDAVLWAVENGITNGTSATTFSPSNPCTRAQMATFLWRAAGSPEPVGSTNPFVDVPADAYYAKAVQWAYEQGITGGTSANTFSPDQTCTRGQMATFLWRDAGSSAVSSEGAPFVDVPDDAYYASAVDWAYEEGITGGTSATTYSPNDPCTRGQMVTFLYRYLAD